MFEFLGNLFNQLIEIAQLVISYITQGLPGAPPTCPEMPSEAIADTGVTCGEETWPEAD